DFAYFEYATVIPPVGNQREGIPAHYLIEVRTSLPLADEKREKKELQRFANDFLVVALNEKVDATDLKEISESDVKGLKKVRLVGRYHDGAVYLVEETK